MVFSSNSTRNISILLIKHNNKVLVVKGYDEVKKEYFYRPLGGGVEFGELSLDAVKREIKEELKADLKNVGLIDVIENIFTFNGIQGHEVIFVYKADFKKKDFYSKNILDVYTSKKHDKAYWIDIEEFKKINIYPTGIEKYL